MIRLLCFLLGSYCVGSYNGQSDKFQQARELFYETQYNEAIALFRQIETTDKNERQLLKYMGLCYHGLKDYDSTVYYLSRAIQKGEHDYIVFINAGNAEYKLGNAEQAYSYFIRAYEIDPVGKHVNYNLAMTLWLRRDDIKEALRYINKEIELEPTNTDALAMKAQMYLNSDRIDSSLMYFTQAIDIESNNANLYWLRGLAYGSAEDWEPAIVDFSKCIALDVNRYDAVFYRAQAQIAIKRVKEACDDMNSIPNDFDEKTELDSLRKLYCK